MSLLLLLSGDVSLNPGPVTDRVRMATINVQSLCNKAASFSDLVSSKKLDIIAVTETWLSPKETKAGLADVASNGYRLIHKARPGGQTGGGVAILASDQFNLTKHEIPEYSRFLSQFVAKYHHLHSVHTLSVCTSSRGSLLNF